MTGNGSHSERDELSMNSNSLPVVSITSKLAYTFGTADAKHGASFAPEMYFTHPSDKREYALGYESIAGRTVFTAQFTKGN